MAKSQSWSLDVIIAVVVFVGAFLLFFSAVQNDEDTKLEDAKKEVIYILAAIKSEDSAYSIMKNDEVKDEELFKLTENPDFQALKENLGVKNDFCIFFEDANGDVLLINGSVYGVGSPNIQIAGQQCT